MRENWTGGGSYRVSDKVADMRAFDQLPRVVRDEMNYAEVNCAAYPRLQIHYEGYTPDAIVRHVRKAVAVVISRRKVRGA